MTSGIFQSVLVDSITVDRDVRQRREMKNIDELAQSIAARGLIHPIVITRDGVLVAGERRLTAILQLGWTHVTAQYVEDLPKEELELIELEENTRREDISWQEQCVAVERLHAIYASREPNWKAEDTAEAIGLSVRHVWDLLRIQRAVQSGDKTITTAPTLSAARNLSNRRTKRAEANLVSLIMDAPKPENTVPLVNADFFEWIIDYTGPSFNFIHCDFPYGINYDKSHGMNSAKVERYADSFENYERLVEEGLRLIPTAESAHMMFWFSMRYYAYTTLALRNQGWKVDHFPLIWAKSDNLGIMPDHNRGGRRTYETALFCSRGDRPVVQPVAMHWHGPKGESSHNSMKPRPMLSHFFRMFVDESTIMLDPTCGSGNSVWCAKEAGAQLFIGIEASEAFYQDALGTWEEEMAI